MIRLAIVAGGFDFKPASAAERTEKMQLGSPHQAAASRTCWEGKLDEALTGAYGAIAFENADAIAR